MDLKEATLLGNEGERHWYYVAKGMALRALIGTTPVREVLDVGAGSGIFSRQLLDLNLAASAVCVDPGYSRDWEETRSGRPIRFVRHISAPTQDLILMMDVLEHVPDDLALLRQYTESMSVSGRVVITVPAFQWLWSGHDVFLEHYRRYTLSDVELLVRNAGLHPLCGRYFFGAIFPVAAIVRLTPILRRNSSEPKSALKVYPRWINSMLTKVHAIERSSLLRFNRLAGLSVICVASR